MFFFSSRRRHTRYWRDWSSDVCSSDLAGADRERDGRQGQPAVRDVEREDQQHRRRRRRDHDAGAADRSEERRVGKSVDLGGRRIIKKKTKVYTSSLTLFQYHIPGYYIR